MFSIKESTPRTNNTSLNTSKSVELPFMMSILRTLKEHFNSINKSHYDNKAPIEDLFNLFYQLLNNYIQLYLPIKSKQNYIKATTSITNTLKDDITFFLDNHYSSNNYIHNNKTTHSSNCNSSSTFLNISSESSFTLNNGIINSDDKDKLNDSFLDCRELSNENIIEKIKQKIERKNIDLTIQYNTLPTYPNNTNNSNTNIKTNNHINYYPQSIFTPVKDIKPRYYHNKQYIHNTNGNICKNKKNIKSTKGINLNSIETPISNNTTSIYKERTLSVPNKKDKQKQMINSIQSNNKTQNNKNKDISNTSLDKKNILNHSFNHPVHSHRHYSVPSQINQSNKHLRTYSNVMPGNKGKDVKEEPVLTTTTMINQQNQNESQNEKMNCSVNDGGKLNATFVCTTVKSGNVVHKYTLNTKANQNIPKASRFANCLLSKYKGLIAAYNEGQVSGKK